MLAFFAQAETECRFLQGGSALPEARLRIPLSNGRCEYQPYRGCNLRQRGERPGLSGGSAPYGQEKKDVVGDGKEVDGQRDTQGQLCPEGGKRCRGTNKIHAGTNEDHVAPEQTVERNKPAPTRLEKVRLCLAYPEFAHDPSVPKILWRSSLWDALEKLPDFSGEKMGKAKYGLRRALIEIMAP